MKLFYLFIPLLFFLFFIGCSHTYEVSKYYPKEQLYEDFNRSTDDRKLEITTLANDSSFCVLHGAIITNDSMIFNTTLSLERKSIPMIDIEKVNYKNHWEGAIPGFLGGAVVGGAIGSTGWIFNPQEGGNNPRLDKFAATLSGAITGAIIGAVIGYICTQNTYQFNP